MGGDLLSAGAQPIVGKMRRSERNGYRECAAPTRLASHADIAAMQLDQFLHQREADAAALEGAPAGAFDAAEALEQMRQLFGRDARAGVMHADLSVAAVGRGLNSDADLALEGELEGVGEQVENDLFPHVAIDIDRLRQRRDIDHQPQARFVDRRAKIRGEFGGIGRKIGRLDNSLSRGRPRCAKNRAAY